MSRRWANALVIGVLMVIGVAPAAAQDSEPTEVVVTALHAIPGDNDFPADVYINGELAIEGFTKMMKSDPFVIEPGELLIEIFPSGADPTEGDPALSQVVDLTDPGNFAMVAQLVGPGTPVLSLYLNDISPVAMGQGRFVFRQTSAVDSVDILADGEIVATGLATSDEVTVTLPAGTFELTVVPAGGTEPLVTSDVELVEGELTVVYAISTQSEDALDLAVQTIAGIETAPAVIETGTGGLAADPSATWWPAALAVLLAVVAAGGGLVSHARKDRL